MNDHECLKLISCGQVLDGCLRGKPVAEKFNLTEALAFFEEYPATAEEVICPCICFYRVGSQNQCPGGGAKCIS